MSFDPSQFVEDPSQERFEVLRKNELLQLATYLKLTSVRTHMRKYEVRNIVLKYLVENQYLDDSALLLIEHVQKTGYEQNIDIEFAKIELEKLRLVERENERIERARREENERIERERREENERIERENERVEREKDRLFQLEMKKLELSGMGSKPFALGSFDVTKHIRLVPPFQEKDVDKYFLHFEKVAENLKWPKPNWALLLQSVLIGKAREI